MVFNILEHTRGYHEVLSVYLLQQAEYWLGTQQYNEAIGEYAVSDTSVIEQEPSTVDVEHSSDSTNEKNDSWWSSGLSLIRDGVGNIVAKGGEVLKSVGNVALNVLLKIPEVKSLYDSLGNASDVIKIVLGRSYDILEKMYLKELVEASVNFKQTYLTISKMVL